jgi:hypothetical protein
MNKKTSKKITSKTTSKITSKTTSKKISKKTSKKNSKQASKTTSKSKSNNINQIIKNINSVKKKLTDKNIKENFWVICDRVDFKPLTKIIVKDNDEEIKSIIRSIKEIRDHLLDEKGEYYSGKKFANIKVQIHTDILTKLINLKYKGPINNSILLHKDFKEIIDKPILSVIITVYVINDSGNINTVSPTDSDTWGLKVNYYIDDFSSIKFKLKNVEVLMRLVTDSVVKSDLIKGISWKNIANKLKSKK